MDTPKVFLKDWSATSSTVGTTNYNPETKTLTVLYMSGDTYDYFDVPEEVYDTLLNSQSIGSAMSLNVKGHYRYEKRQK